MKIQLQEPYASDWRLGYLVTNRENRKHVILFNSNRDRSTTSYARYLMTCHLGKYISKEYEVDHIDGDKTRDVLENLQLLTGKENHKKYYSKGQTMRTFVCPVCGKEFELTARQSHRKNPTCSRSCGGKKSHWKP